MKAGKLVGRAKRLKPKAYPPGPDIFVLLQGYAVKAGMLVGQGERLLFMDADGATRVSDVEKLEAALATISGIGMCSPAISLVLLAGCFCVGCQ